jgi:phosphoglycerate dehydrogenase-like enzyme
MKLVTTRAIPPEQRACLEAADPQLHIVTAAGRDPAQLLQEAADADIIAGSFGGGSGNLFRSVILAAPRVRWVHTSSAGVDEILCPEFYERDFILTCGKGESVANLLAEHAMALLLALTRGLVAGARQKEWQREHFPGRPTEIRGLTMGIVGFGSVGQALAVRAQAFGMGILGIKAHPTPPPPGVEAIWGPETLPTLLGRSDVVVLILPNTPQTVGSFGEAQLRQMKRTAYLINVGRGQVMDGAALERALVEGWIAGAGLDVMSEEPWPASSPLWRMDNVLITPHIAGNSPQRGARDMQAFCENFARFMQGQPMTSVVSREEQY